MAVLEVENLKTYFPLKKGLFKKRKYVKAVDDVSFKINKGETVGLVGESGCGKSTLGRSIVKLENPSAGSVVINGENIGKLSKSALRKKRTAFQMIFQDPYSSLNQRMKVERALDEILALHTDLNTDDRHKEIAELLDLVGLKSEHMHRYPHQFSGGQRQRIGIARALAVNPEIIVADEPVSALDVSVQAQIINLMKKIQEERSVAYLFIAHDLAVVEHISTQIMVMYLGKIVESGESSLICSKPAHPYTSALLSAVPSIDPATKKKRIILPGDVPSPVDPPKACPFHPRCPKAEEICTKQTPLLKETKGNKSHLSACHFPENE